MVTVVDNLKKTKNLIVFCMIFLVILNIVSAECSDTDSGRDYYQKGHFVGTNVWGDEIDVEDSCMDDGTTLTENYCEEGYFKRETYDCSSEGLICFLGKCKEESDTNFCEDDEVGKSSDVQGSITFRENNEEKHAMDDCSVAPDTPNLLYEWYCDGASAKFDEIYCDSFCYKGTCQSCIDSDSGKNYYEKGSTKGSSGTIKEDECNSNILQEYYCSNNGLLQQEIVNCDNFGEICSDGMCIENPCTDDEPQKDIAVKGTVHYYDQVGDDYCDNNILKEVYCSGNEALYDKIDCEEMGLKCVAGKCLDEDEITCEDSDPENDISQLGVITIAGETQKDFCYGETLVQFDCKKNEITTEDYICSKEGKYCLNGVCKNCPQGTIYDGGRCGVPDYDGDGIPDLEETKKCLDTSPGDAINDEGCSCEQGAEEVYVDENGEQILKSCKDLEKQNEPCNDGSKGHCCNSIKDKDELLADCGGKDCSSCEGVCTKIIDGGDLDILFVPVAYTSSTDLSVINNIDEWETRAELEASKITSTPPFDSGQVSVWRLDLFSLNPSLIKEIVERKADNFDFLLNVNEYKGLCSSTDLITFLPSNLRRSFASLVKGVSVVYNKEDLEDNVIVHELGHSFCGLDDEYIEDIGLFDQFGNSIWWTHINCDNAPQLWTYADGTEELKCKWWREFPDAGCIKGCNYNDNWYRPKNDFEDSMMRGNKKVGPSDYGKGTWNQVSYERCKELVENYES